MIENYSEVKFRETVHLLFLVTQNGWNSDGACPGSEHDLPHALNFCK